MRTAFTVIALLLCRATQAQEPAVFAVPPGYDDLWPGSTVHVGYVDYVLRGDGTMAVANSPIHSTAGLYPHFSAFDKPYVTDSPHYRGGHVPRPHHYQRPRGLTILGR